MLELLYSGYNDWRWSLTKFSSASNLFLASVSRALFRLAGPINVGLLVLPAVVVDETVVVAFTTGTALFDVTLVDGVPFIRAVTRLPTPADVVRTEEVLLLFTRLELAEATVMTPGGRWLEDTTLTAVLTCADDTSDVRNTGLPVTGSTVATGAPVAVVEVRRAANDKAPVPVNDRNYAWRRFDTQREVIDSSVPEGTS